MIKRENKLPLKKILYPCNLGISLYHEYSESLIDELISNINLVYDSFFYNIFVSKLYESIPNNLINLGREENLSKIKKGRDIVLVYPTDYFYNSLTDLKNQYSTLRIKLGITDLPIYSSTYENLIFLYGEAHLYEKCAVVSTYNLCDFQNNLNKEHHIVEERIIKESIHELGHLILGDFHCFNSTCVMKYSNNLSKVDEKSVLLCKICEEKLEDIRDFYNF